MTKSLTEQRLKDGMYYVMADRYELGEYEPTIAECYRCKFNWDIVKEVLAPVPSYEEYKEMDNDLKEIASKNDSLAMECGKLQEQLKKYNELDYQIKVQRDVADRLNLEHTVEKLEQRLYDKDQGFVPVLNIVLRNIEREQAQRKLTDLELSIKSQVKGVLAYNGLVSNYGEVEKLKEQLKEANEVILGLHKPYGTSLEPATIYLDKWGVK